MRDLQIDCEKCGTTLTIVREWPDGWKYRATVEPCPDCMEEAAQQSAQADLLEWCGCEGNPPTMENGKCSACGKNAHR